MNIEEAIREALDKKLSTSLKAINTIQEFMLNQPYSEEVERAAISIELESFARELTDKDLAHLKLYKHWIFLGLSRIPSNACCLILKYSPEDALETKEKYLEEFENNFCSGLISLLAEDITHDPHLVKFFSLLDPNEVLNEFYSYYTASEERIITEEIADWLLENIDRIQNLDLLVSVVGYDPRLKEGLLKTPLQTFTYDITLKVAQTCSDEEVLDYFFDKIKQLPLYILEENPALLGAVVRKRDAATAFKLIKRQQTRFHGPLKKLLLEEANDSQLRYIFMEIESDPEIFERIKNKSGMEEQWNQQ